MSDRQQLIVKSLPPQPTLPTAGQHPGAILRYGPGLYWDDGTGAAPTQLDRQTLSAFVIDTQTASFTLGAGDIANGYVRCNFSAAGTVTIPAGLTTLNVPINVSWVGTQFGYVSIAPAGGVTLRNTNGNSFVSVTLLRPGAIVSITQVATNVWEFVGPTDCQPIGGIYRLGYTVSVNNTTAETSVLPTPAAGVAYGFKVIKANVALPGLQLLAFIGGLYSTPVSPSNLTLRIKLGTVTVASVSLTGFAASAANAKLGIEVNLIYRSIGSTGTVQVSGVAYYNGTTLMQIPLDVTSPVTVDTTVDSAIDVTLQWSAAQTGQLVNVYSALIQANQ